MRKGTESFRSMVITTLNTVPVRHELIPAQRKVNDFLTDALTASYDSLLEDDADKALVDMEYVLDHASSVLMQLHSNLHEKNVEAGRTSKPKKEGYMKKFMLLCCLAITISCSSDPFKVQRERNEMIVEHMKQGKQYIGGQFDPRFNASGSDGMTLRAVGTSVYPIEANEELSKAKAVSSAKFKLIESAPTEFKSLVQQAIGNSLGYVGEFTQIETSITEVHALRGIEIKQDDVVCKMVVEPTIDGDYRNVRECKAIARIPLVELKRAFDFTMEQKYGPQQKTDVERLLQEQLRQKSLSGPKVVSTQE